MSCWLPFLLDRRFWPFCHGLPKPNWWRQAEALETAIVERRRIELERYASVASFPGSPLGSFRAWPLQLLFHTIGWYLVFEEDSPGQEEGLIRCERLDRLALRRSERGTRRAEDSHQQALDRLQTLLHQSIAATSALRASALSASRMAASAMATRALEWAWASGALAATGSAQQ